MFRLLQGVCYDVFVPKKQIAGVPDPDDMVSAIRALMRSQDKISKLRQMGLDRGKTGDLTKQAAEEVAKRQEALKKIFPPKGGRGGAGRGGAGSGGLGEGRGGGGFLKRTK